LVNLELVKLSPTWRNCRSRNDVVAKRLNRFLISEKLLGMGLRFKVKVEEWGNSDHRPISIFWILRADSPPAPLKINQVWFVEEDFRKLVESAWVRLNHDGFEPFMVQFKENLKHTKSTIKKWISVWKANRKKELLET